MIECIKNSGEAIVKNATIAANKSSLDAAKITDAELREKIDKHLLTTIRSLDAAYRQKARQSFTWGLITACCVFILLLAGFGWFYVVGTKSSYASGKSEAMTAEAAASWANTPEGQRAYKMSQDGLLAMFSQCSGDGWRVVKQDNGKKACFPGTGGWYLP
jgi:hypothetical protein